MAVFIPDSVSHPMVSAEDGIPMSDNRFALDLAHGPAATNGVALPNCKVVGLSCKFLEGKELA